MLIRKITPAAFLLVSNRRERLNVAIACDEEPFMAPEECRRPNPILSDFRCGRWLIASPAEYSGAVRTEGAAFLSPDNGGTEGGVKTIDAEAKPALIMPSRDRRKAVFGLSVAPAKSFIIFSNRLEIKLRGILADKHLKKCFRFFFYESCIIFALDIIYK